MPSAPCFFSNITDRQLQTWSGRLRCYGLDGNRVRKCPRHSAADRTTTAFDCQGYVVARERRRVGWARRELRKGEEQQWKRKEGAMQWALPFVFTLRQEQTEKTNRSSQGNKVAQDEHQHLANTMKSKSQNTSRQQPKRHIFEDQLQATCTKTARVVEYKRGQRKSNCQGE